MFYRANSKRGYLAITINDSITEIGIERIDYGGEDKDRNIPIVAGEKIILIIWSKVQPRPGLDDAREIVVAEYLNSDVTGGIDYFTVERAKENTLASTHYIGDNIAAIFTDAMSREILIFEDLRASTIGSIGYTDDMELEPLIPDNKTDPGNPATGSKCDGKYHKILMCQGSGNAPIWKFAYDQPLPGALKQPPII